MFCGEVELPGHCRSGSGVHRMLVGLEVSVLVVLLGILTLIYPGYPGVLCLGGGLCLPSPLVPTHRWGVYEAYAEC
jgi:hypothetical protein